MTQTILCGCGGGAFLPTGEYRQLKENDYYLMWDDGEKSPIALQHLCDWPEGPAFVILRDVQPPHVCLEPFALEAGKVP